MTPSLRPAAAIIRKRLGFVLFAYVLCVTLVVTLAPFRFGSMEGIRFGWRSPLQAVLDLGTNVTMFMPLGFLFRLNRPRGYRSAIEAVAMGLLVSLFIEGAQLFEHDRYASPFDVICNAAGAWAGALVHDQMQRRLRLDADFVGKVALDLPLMSLVYLLVPLLWLNGLAAGSDPSIAWFTPLLAAFGAIILGAIHRHYLRPTRFVTNTKVALGAALWFTVGAVPGLATAPKLTAACGIGVAIIVAAQALWRLPPGPDRRFEIPVLRSALPIYGLYLCLLSLWPIPRAFHALRIGWELDRSFLGAGADGSLKLLEHVAAFTLLGYIAAELRGRLNEPYRVTARAIALACGALAAILELTRGFHPRHRASYVHFLVTLAACLCGGAIYRLQRDHVRRVVATRASIG